MPKQCAGVAGDDVVSACTPRPPPAAPPSLQSTPRHEQILGAAYHITALLFRNPEPGAKGRTGHTGCAVKGLERTHAAQHAGLHHTAGPAHPCQPPLTCRAHHAAHGSLLWKEALKARIVVLGIEYQSRRALGCNCPGNCTQKTEAATGTKRSGGGKRLRLAPTPATHPTSPQATGYARQQRTNHTHKDMHGNTKECTQIACGKSSMQHPKQTQTLRGHTPRQIK